MAKGITPFWWSLFGAGGTVSALLFPIHILLIGLAIPLKWVDAPDYETLHNLVTYPLTRFVPVRADFPPAVPLGAPLPVHTLRSVPIKDGYPANRCGLLRRRSYWHIHGGVYAVDGLVDMVCRRPASSAT